MVRKAHTRAGWTTHSTVDESPIAAEATIADWFEAVSYDAPKCDTPGQLSAYMSMPTRTGMTNPPQSDKVKKELLKYLRSSGVPSQVPYVARSPPSLPGISRASSRASSPKHKMFGGSRPGSVPTGGTEPFHGGSRPNSVGVESFCGMEPFIGMEPDDRHLLATPELRERRDKRIENLHGDLGLEIEKVRALQKCRTTIQVTGTSRMGARHEGTGSQRLNSLKRQNSGALGNGKVPRSPEEKGFRAWGSSEKEKTEHEITDATWDLKMRSRFTRMSRFDNSESEGELNIYHNKTMRFLNPSRIRVPGVPFEEVKSHGRPSVSSPSHSDISSPSRKKKGGDPPSPFRPDPGPQRLRKLQARVGQNLRGDSSYINVTMSRNPAKRRIGSQEKAEGTNQAYVQMMISSSIDDIEPGDLPRTVRYGKNELVQLAKDADLPPSSLASTKRRTEKNEDVSKLMNTMGTVYSRTKVPDTFGEIDEETRRKEQQDFDLSRRYGVTQPFTEAMHKRFDKLDHSGDGKLGPEEFAVLVRDLLNDPTVTDTVIAKMWRDFDSDNSGEITFEEYLKFLIQKYPNIKTMTPHELNRFIAGCSN